MAKTNKPHSPRNYEISPGLMRFSRARMYQKRGVYKKKKFQPMKKTSGKQDLYVVKKIGGDKNGGERKVLKQKQPRAMSMFRIRAHKSRAGKKSPQEKLRPTLTPGTVVILLAGRHKGKRCVFLRQLSSGLLLVTGPLKLNNCPLRRIAQCYVIGTQTKLDISGVKIPDTLNDDYFKRAKKTKKSNKEEPDIFAQHKEDYVVSDQRKEDQKSVDGQLLDVIRKNKDKKILFGYLGSSFSLKKGQFPHQMVF